MAPKNPAKHYPAKRYETAVRARTARPGAVAGNGPLYLFLLTVGASAGAAAYASRTMSPDGFLPVLSGVLFVSAALLAAIGWRERKARPDTVTYWDVAGAVTLIGCAAAMMSEPENVMQVFGLKQKN